MALIVMSQPGQVVPKGDIFGMIRIGSQVDLVVTLVPGMQLRVKPGDKVVRRRNNSNRIIFNTRK